MQTKIQLFLLILLTAVSGRSLHAQIVGEEVLRMFEEAAKHELEQYLREQDSLDTTHDEGWDEHLHTSDMEGDTAAQYFYRHSPPPEGVRVGCVCMDGDQTEQTGFGACSGHGGVRFWLYKITPDSIIPYPTRRHFEHPDELTMAELENLAAHQERDHPLGATKSSGSSDSLWHMLTAMVVCITLAYLAKTWWNQ